MRIAQIAPLQVAVPPRDYGGTERVIATLTNALVDLGHDVTLFASGESRTQAHLVAARPTALNFSPLHDAIAEHVALLTAVYRRAAEFDVIHSHLDYLTLPFAHGIATPTVLTLHGRLDAAEHVRLYRQYRGANYVSISQHQRRPAPDLNWVATIYHGIAVEQFPFSAEPGTYLAFVGRISPDKRPDRAIAIARRAGIPLKIAAKVDPGDQAYFEAVIKPLLDDPRVEFLGPIDETSKRELLVGALALVMPIDWPEPFGLVFIEALACGTPVLACLRGSAPELLADGVTGYMRESDEELAAAVRQVGRLSRARCREYALHRFGARRMAERYLCAYAAVCRGADTCRNHLAQNVVQEGAGGLSVGGQAM
jgi:glycosyltransferase involved in cell wall biosynthesis